MEDFVVRVYVLPNSIYNSLMSEVTQDCYNILRKQLQPVLRIEPWTSKFLN